MATRAYEAMIKAHAVAALFIPASFAPARELCVESSPLIKDRFRSAWPGKNVSMSTGIRKVCSLCSRKHDLERM